VRVAQRSVHGDGTEAVLDGPVGLLVKGRDT
jgi:hypothetical protein